jgi:hypothetical protein
MGHCNILESHGGSYEELTTDVSEEHIDSIFRIE